MGILRTGLKTSVLSEKLKRKHEAKRKLDIQHVEHASDQRHCSRTSTSTKGIKIGRKGRGDGGREGAKKM